MGQSVARPGLAVLVAALAILACGGKRDGGEKTVQITQKLSADAPGLRATFYSDMNLDRPVLTRVDGSVDFNWGLGSPAAGVAVDQFSARWQGQVQPLYTETYTFITRADDGVRLWVNGQLIINNWVNQAATERTGTIALVAGARYDIRLEYFDNAEDGLVQLSWRSSRQAQQIIPASQLFAGPEPAESAPVAPFGLNASYYQGTALAGSPLLTQVDPNIDFNWGTGSPGAGVPVDGFSARWQGQVQPRFSETYTFITRADDGVRLWVNGQQVINNWVNQSLTERTGTIALTAGTWYDIRVEYFDSSAGATLQVLWQSTSQPRQVIPSWRLSPGCNNSRLNTLVVNGGFECDLAGWSEGYFRNPGWGTGAITLARVAGAGGTQGALRVVVPATYPSDANPSPPQPYYAGAHVALKEELPAGSWVRVAFDARRVTGGRFLTVERPFGGALHGGGVPLTDDWQMYVTLLRLDHPTSTLIFNLHRLGFPYIAEGGEFLLDNLSVTKVPKCTDVPTGNKDRELVCFPPQTPAGQALRVTFNAHSPSGARTLRVTGPRGGDIGDNTMVSLGTTSAAHQVTVRNQNANEPLSLRLVPYYYYFEPHAAAGSFVAARPTFTVVAECNNTPGVTNPGVLNGGFECDRSFWSPIYWHEPERTFRGDVISLSRVAGAGGSQGALRVTVPSTFPAGVDPNGQLHMSGAAAGLKPEVPAGFVRVSFDARRISGSANLSIYRIWGGSGGISYTQLTDEWRPYTLTFRLDYPTGGLTFTTWTGSQPFVAAGVFEIDNLRVAPAPTFPVEVAVTSAAGVPMAGREVNAFQGTQPFGAKATTDASGRVRLLVPTGSYRFGASDGAITFYSGASDHCEVLADGGCRAASIVFAGEVANVRVTPEVVSPGAIVDVSWSGIQNPQRGDNLGLYAVGAASPVAMTQLTGETAAGSARLGVPFATADGDYEVRLARDVGTVLARSNRIRVTIRPCAGATNGASCSDGNFCNGLETCEQGLCRPGEPVVCPSSGSCASFGCNPNSGQCEQQLAPAGTSCDDGNACSTGDGCDGAGTCIGGQPVNCQGGTACAPNRCNPANGNCEFVIAAAGSPCSDGNVCTQMDTCDDNGHCVGGQGVSCDHGDECSAESCDPSLGCQSTQLCSGEEQSLHPVSVLVVDPSGTPRPGVPVVAYDGSSAMGPPRLTNADGHASFALPPGDYHFTATVDGGQFSSSLADECAMGVCDQVSIISQTVTPAGCDTDESCTSRTGGVRRLHVVAASAGGSDLFHAVRDNNSATFQSPFGDVLEQAGRPWQQVATTTKIVDVAAQSRGNQLIVAVLIQTSPDCPLDPGCHEPPNQPPDPADIHYSVWWTERHPGFWTTFSRLPLEPAVPFRSIVLTGVGRDYATFCGSSADGDIWIADAAPLRAPAGWTSLRSVKQMAAGDPGFATRVSCQRELEGMPLLVTALAGGRAWGTYVDPLREHARPSDVSSNFPLQDPPGFDDLTQRLALPPGLTSIQVGGIDKIGHIHLVAGTPSGPALHAFTRRPTTSNWTVPSPLDAVLGAAGSSVTSTAVVSGAGHLQVLQSTAEGRLLMATRLSASGGWTGQSSLGPEALNGRRFGNIAASEELLIPFAIDVDPVLEMDATTLRFTWRDSDDFEEGYRIYGGNSLIAAIPPTPGSPGIPTVAAFELPKADLEAGRLYRFDMAAFAPAGDSYRRAVQSPGGPLITVAQPVLTKLERWETDGGGCFTCDEKYRFYYAFRDSSVGPANLQGTRSLQLSAIHDDGQRSWTGPVFAPAPHAYHVIGRDEYRSGLGGTVVGWRFTLQATGFDGSRRVSPYARFNRLATDTVPPPPPPGSPPPEIIDPPPPTCCAEKQWTFEEE